MENTGRFQAIFKNRKTRVNVNMMLTIIVLGIMRDFSTQVYPKDGTWYAFLIGESIYQWMLYTVKLTDTRTGFG